MGYTAFPLHKALACRQDFMQKRRRLQMKNNKETAPSTEKEREDFWLEIGPASAYEGLDCCETARRDGDASPDGLAHGFEGAESPKDLVTPPDDDPDSEPVPHLPPQLKALEWLDTMGSPDDVPPIDR